AAPLDVSSIPAVFVNPLATVHDALDDTVPSTRSTEPDCVVIAPVDVLTPVHSTTPPFVSVPPVWSELTICSVPVACTVVGADSVELVKLTAVPALIVSVEGPATMLVFTSRCVALLASALFRFSCELTSDTVPAPPSVPPL